MTHLSDEVLVSFAFGDATPDADQVAHLRTCTRCDAELTALRRPVDLGRELREVELVEPPEAVWAAIHSELQLSPELTDVPRAERHAPSGLTTIRDRRLWRGYRRRTLLTRKATISWIAAASILVGLVIGIAGTTALTRPAPPRLLAEAVLEPFPGWSASGTARVVEETAGERQVLVDVSSPDEGLREVWLINPDTSGLISLGLISGSTGTFAIPGDVDLTRYSVIDISQEPDDGNPAHSGDSIVRGQFDTS